MKLPRILYFLSFIILVVCSKPELQNGVDVLFKDNFDLIKGKRVGLVCNHTALLKNGTHLVDMLENLKDVELVSIFSPEHGFTGDIEAGERIESGQNSEKNIKIWSLYGKITKPTEEMLEEIDVLIYDIQDIGARFYTYTSTMAMSMEAAAENGKKFVILDRLNPIGGKIIEGPVLNKGFSSFVGLFEIPVRYGLTIGEFAKMINEEGWLKNGVKADLEVVKVKNWKRSRTALDYNLNWIKPSPNIPDIETALIYPGLCLLEGINISEGRGTMTPFKVIGAPWIDPKRLLDELENFNIKGVKFENIEYIPEDIKGMAVNPKYEGEICRGIKISVTNPAVFKSLYNGICIIYSIRKLFPEEFQWRKSLYIDKLWGSDSFRKMIDEQKTPEEIIRFYNKELESFNTFREKYLLYN
ncbi:exo-beta-N-acetylmuramidase NamZ domain-containing protein [candidate division KSB1 bacterium]